MSKKKQKNYSEVLNRLKEQSKKGQGKGDYITLEDGDNQVRILPGHPNMDGFFTEVYYHGHKLNGKREQVRCLNNGDIDGDSCPVCDAIRKYKGSKNKSDKSIWNDTKPKARFFMNAINRAEEKPKVQIFACGISTITQILTFVTDPDYGDITDPVEGLDIVINKSGDGLDTEYSVKPRRKSTPILKDEDEVAEILGTSAEDTKLTDLSEKTVEFDDEPEKVTQIWDKGWASLKDESDDDDDEKPKKKKKKVVEEEDEEEEEEEPKPKKKKKPVVEEEDEEEEEEEKPKKKKHKKPVVEEEEDEEEEEEEPAPKKTKKAPKKVVEEDDEEEEEEEEEIPKKPKKKKKQADEDDELASLEEQLNNHKKKKK